jgi:hypothetical protein
MPDIQIKRYQPSDKPAWDDFVSRAKNATFLFRRDYMDYHSGRFNDHSLMIYSGNNLNALFVGNESGQTIHSHAGLSYGGMILEKDAGLADVLRFFYHVVKFYSTSFSNIIYKCLPPPFMRQPSYDDLYALFRLEADLIGRQTSSVYTRQASIPYHDSRKGSVTRIERSGLLFSVVKSSNPVEFWARVLEPSLGHRHDTRPVHSAEEMTLLMTRFPSNIHLYELRDDEAILAGAVIYEMDDIVHTQYLSNTPPGREVDALDSLIDHLMTEVYTAKSYFSFGSSNNDFGRALNLHLLKWKERFGARTWVQDTYDIKTSRYHLLSDFQ